MLSVLLLGRNPAVLVKTFSEETVQPAYSQRVVIVSCVVAVKISSGKQKPLTSSTYFNFLPSSYFSTGELACVLLLSISEAFQK